MKVISLVSILAVTALGACSHYSQDLASMEKSMGNEPATQMAMAPQDVMPAAGGIIPPTPTTTLAREYYEMARYENDTAFDYKAAKTFTEKAKLAAEGKPVAPSPVSAYDIPSKNIAELTTARTQLMTALQTQSTPENQSTLAVAQARYECWLERAEEATNQSHYESCKNDFLQSMAMLTAPAAGEAMPATGMTAYEIKFVPNSALIDESSKNAVQYIADTLNKPENATYTANVTGFIGGATGEFANQLANARVNAVRSALMGKNVQSDRLMVGDAGPMTGDAASSSVRVILNVPTNANPAVQTTTTFVPAMAAPSTTAPVQQ